MRPPCPTWLLNKGLVPLRGPRTWYGATAYEQLPSDDWRLLAAAVSAQPLVVALVGAYSPFQVYDRVSETPLYDGVNAHAF